MLYLCGAKLNHAPIKLDRSGILLYFKQFWGKRQVRASGIGGAGSSLVSSQQQKAEVLIGGNPCMPPSSDWNIRPHESYPT